ncbi:MAG: hypothetical protein HDS44_01250 [Bacteroides sp.]|nr:hypothetical protein [Bacteroides sp.]
MPDEHFHNINDSGAITAGCISGKTTAGCIFSSGKTIAGWISSAIRATARPYTDKKN